MTYSRTQKYTAIILICAFLLITPFHATQAAEESNVNIIGIALSPLLATVILTLTIIKWIVGLVFTTISHIVEVLLEAFSYMPEQIRKIWELIRDIVNMAFILILIVMAFGTIFQIPHYTYKEMFGPFLIAAIMINFSFAIGDYIIHLSNGIAHVFFNTIREALNGDITGIFNIGFSRDTLGADPSFLDKIKDFFEGVVSFGFTGVLLRSIFNLLFSIIFLAVGIFALVVIAIFMLVRWPALWLLLIASPAAWVAYALPGHMKSFWKTWWKAFMGWNFFIPIYAFFLMLLAIILKARGTMGYAAPSGNPLVIGINEIIFFVITVVFAIGGIWAAWKLSSSLGGGAGSVGNWIANSRAPMLAATSILGGATGLAGRGLSKLGGKIAGGRTTGLRSKWGGIISGMGSRTNKAADAIRAQKTAGDAVTAVKATTARIMAERGIPFIARSEHNEKLDVARAKDAAEKAAGLAPQYHEQKEVKAQAEHHAGIISAQVRNGQLDQTEFDKRLAHALNTNNTVESGALALVAAEKGWMNDPTRIHRVLESIGGTTSELGKDFFEKLKPNLNKTTVDALYSASSGADEISFAMLRAEKGWSASIAEMDSTIRNLGGPNTKAAKDYLDAQAKNGFTFSSPTSDLTAVLRHGMDASVDEAVRRKIVVTAGDRNQLQTDDQIEAVAQLTEGRSAEERLHGEEVASKNIRNIARNTFERQQLIQNTGAQDRVRKAAARFIVDNNEVKFVDYKTYSEAQKVLGSSNAKALEMRAQARQEA